jgi:hypothetical protein
MGGHIFRRFDHQKGCPDSEILDGGSKMHLSAVKSSEDFYIRRKPAGVTDKPEVIPGQKSSVGVPGIGISSRKLT